MRFAVATSLLLGAFFAGASGLSDAERNNSGMMNAGVAAHSDRPFAGGVRILFLGNSITLHKPLASIGWTNTWGVAASCAESDYVHLVTRGIEAATGRRGDVRVRNLAAFERGFETYDFAQLDDLVAFRPDYLIVALGENVRNLASEADRLNYRAAFKKLLERFTYGRMKPHTVVRGVFWSNPVKDAQMAHAASDLAMPFVSAEKSNASMTAAGLFAHAGVANHPGDKGMAMIADAILEGFFPKNSGFTASVDGHATKVMPIRVSGQPFNQWAPGYQRPVDQTEIAGLLRFETDGPSQILVHPARAFTNALVRPLSAKVKCAVEDGEVRFTLPKPGYYVLELDDHHRPLEIFAEPRRDFAEERKAANIVFGPGRHEPVVVKLKSHDRVFLDRDAVVFGSFQADGAEDVKVSGYGIICGERNRRVGDACYREGMDGAVRIVDSKNISFDGPTVLDSCCWCVAAFNSRDITLRNMKVTGAWRYNTDGIDICNSQRVRVENCYVHSFDDALVVKGISHDYVASRGVLSLGFEQNDAVEDVRFSKCVCWCGWGRTLEVGLETWASAFRGIVFEDCDLIHNASAALSVHLGGPTVVDDITYRNIRIECDGLEEGSIPQRSRDQRVTCSPRKNHCWLVVENAKMFSPNGMYTHPRMKKLADEPCGNFRRLSVENIQIFRTNGAPEPTKRIAPQPGTTFGEMKISTVRDMPYIGKYQTDGVCSTDDVACEVFTEGLSPESVHVGTQEPIPVRHDFPRDLTAWGGLAPLPSVSVGGKALRVEPMRCSAMPVNIRWPGHQREKDQTEICFFARFDLSAPTEVVVTVPRAFTNAAVRPVSKKVAVTRDGDKICFTLAKPGAYSVEFDGLHENLMLFADAPKDYSDIDRKAANVRYYGPGEHDVGLITLKANETLFIDEGAVVYGRIEARDAPGIRICGKGILDASRVKEVQKAIDPKLAEEQRKKGWAIANVERFDTIFPQFCDNVRIEGITIRDSQIYAIRPVCCNGLTIENVKILGSWRYNSDGIDMHNCRHVRIRDCFVRTYDDSICVKGFDYCLPESEMTHNGVVHDIFEDVQVERCTIWNDWGRALEIGAETRAREIRNVTFRDCDILAVQGIALDVQNCDQAHVHDIRFENIRVEYDPNAPKAVYSASAKDFDPTSRCAPARLTGCVIHYIPEYSKVGAENRGRTTDIVFRDIDVYGLTLPGGLLRGFDKDHRIERVAFDRIRLNGKDVTAEFCRKVSRNEFALSGVR